MKRFSTHPGVWAVLLLAVIVLGGLALLLSSRKSPDRASGPHPFDGKPRPSAPLILFDASKGEVWSPRDTGFAGYSHFHLHLKARGYRTAENHKPLQDALAGRGAETLLVVGVAMEQRLTEGERAAVHDFVRKGGKLLVLGEHDNQYGSSDMLNPLIEPGGWQIEATRVVEQEGCLPGTRGLWVRTATPGGGEGPILPMAGRLSALREEGVEVLLRTRQGKRIVAGSGRYGRGTIAVIADSEFLWNSSPTYRWKDRFPIGFQDPNTLSFVDGLLSRIHPPPRPGSRPLFPATGGGEARIFVFGNGGEFSEFDGFLRALSESGLQVLPYGRGIEPADRILVFSPLAAIPPDALEQLARAGKGVLFGEMHTTIRSYADSWEEFFEPMGMVPNPYPLNALSRSFGIRFLPHFGVNLEENEHGHILYVPIAYHGAGTFLHRACTMEIREGAGAKPFSLSPAKGTFACKAGFGLNGPVERMDLRDGKEPRFAASSDRLLAFGDSDIVSNDFLEATRRCGLLDVIISFLAP